MYNDFLHEQEQDSMNVNPKNKERKPSAKAEAWENTPWLEKEAEAIKAARKSKDTEDPVDVLLHDPLAIRLTHRFIKAGVSANAVTFMSLLVGVAGSALFYSHNWWVNLIGILLVIFAAVLDCCDGQIARLTHTSSQFGRVLDGTVDIANFLAIYIVLGLRMMNETIPFTGMKWSYTIWIVILVTMICHASQARMADYYRGLHLFFLEGKNTAYLTRSKNIRKELSALPKDSPFYEKIYRAFYLIYTKDQERQTPWAQRLLNIIEKNGGTASEEVAEAYVTQSRRYIQASNALTYSIRTYGLFLLLLAGIPAFFFPFVIIVLEALKIFVVAKYEGIAKRIVGKYFSGCDIKTSNRREAGRTSE